MSLVNQFMEQLGIMHAPLVGHSMGGTVSLSVAMRYPERVSKVVVVGSPIVGSSLAWPLKLAGYRPIAFMLFNMMDVFRFAIRAAAPFICRDERFAEMMVRDLSRTTVESFLRSIASLRRTDLRPMLDQIRVPALGIYGDRDIIVHPKQWQPMQKGIIHAHIERFPLSGHFPMLEEPQNFAERLKAFLDREESILSPQPSAALSPSPSVTLAP